MKKEQKITSGAEGCILKQLFGVSYLRVRELEIEKSHKWEVGSERK